MGRIIIFSGKGGVGKSSVAAAHALKFAKEGKKTLLVSADMAHNLGDIFETEVGGKVTEIRERLYALELDPDRLMQEEYPDVAESMAKLVQGDGFATADLGGLAIPGFENLFSLLKLADLYHSGEYDAVLLDCAPTGETLSLLKLAELLSWYMEKFFPVGKFFVRVLSPLSARRYHVMLPKREAMDGIERMHQKLLELSELLRDGSICSVRLVCLPEKMVVEETKRLYMYLNLYGYTTDGLFINRILPEDAGMGSGFLQGWRQIQEKYLKELESVFRALPITGIPWFPEEVRGLPAVERFCQKVLGEGFASFGGRVAPEGADPFAVLSDRRESEYYEAIEGGYRLCLRLPGAAEGDLRLSCHALDLDIAIGNFLRKIPLPNALGSAVLAGHRLEGGMLYVDFLLPEET